MKEESIIIRLMGEEDLDEVAVLYTDIYDRLDIGEKWTTKTSRDLMSYWLSKQPDLSFVATRNNKIVGGFTGGIKPWWDGNHLVDGEVFVDYNYHKQGIGSKLSKVIYKTALEKYDIASIDLTTFSKNGFPLSWYKSLGFEENEFLKIISGRAKNVLKNLGG